MADESPVEPAEPAALLNVAEPPEFAEQTIELARHEPAPGNKLESLGQAAGRMLSGLKRWPGERFSRQQTDDLQAEPPLSWDEPPPSSDGAALNRPPNRAVRRPEWLKRERPKAEPTDFEPADFDPAHFEPAIPEPAYLEPASLEPPNLEPATAKRSKRHWSKAEPAIPEPQIAERLKPEPPKAERTSRSHRAAPRAGTDLAEPLRLTDELKGPLVVLMVLAAIVASVGGVIHNSFIGLGGGLMSGAALVGFIIVGLTPTGDDH
ncbi:MAG TPA: hypothetical protein VK735_09780 [Pseudonocardia sp.]|uniref:hypothetical protein n=1 Tax=Pseudonocardia sp. TaxID=60912 RepID=UPI002CDDB5C1|nr:hypothetical protein [Pseudonocardia sp.]HTF47725.1 hypothetical protein [Pseudonocardia sp.]